MSNKRTQSPNHDYQQIQRRIQGGALRAMPPPSPGELKTIIETCQKRLIPSWQISAYPHEQKVQNSRRWLKDDLEPFMMIKDGLGPCNCTCIYLSDSGTEDGEGGRRGLRTGPKLPWYLAAPWDPTSWLQAPVPTSHTHTPITHTLRTCRREIYAPPPTRTVYRHYHNTPPTKWTLHYPSRWILLIPLYPWLRRR